MEYCLSCGHTVEEELETFFLPDENHWETACKDQAACDARCAAWEVVEEACMEHRNDQ